MGIPKILVVDDELELLEIIKLKLEASDYRVVTASDGEEALKKVKSEKPDLIILDLTLPKIDGHEVHRILEADVSYRSIPVVMLTARSDLKDIKEGLDVGAAAYVTKPFKPDVLLGIIQGLLGK